MNIGKFRHRITIEQVAEAQDSNGSVLENWFSLATTLASIEPIPGLEYLAAQCPR
jgi:head-tail adaptor